MAPGGYSSIYDTPSSMSYFIPWNTSSDSIRITSDPESTSSGTVTYVYHDPETDFKIRSLEEEVVRLKLQLESKEKAIKVLNRKLQKLRSQGGMGIILD